MAIIGADTLRRFDIKISFVLTFSSVAILALVIVTFLYWRETQSVKDTLVFFSVGAAAVGQITASFYTARVLNATLRKDDRDARRADDYDALQKARTEREDARQKAQMELALKQATLRFGERWNDPGMFAARDALRLVLKQGTEEERKKFIESQETNVMHIVNFLEEMGTSCRHELVDIKIMREQFDFVIVCAWTKLFPWIKEQRHQDKDIWEDFEHLYDAWK
jgi:ABC-type nickel/cobalt efflux system permease component RcnA